MAKKKGKDLDPKSRGKKVKGGNPGVNIKIDAVNRAVDSELQGTKTSVKNVLKDTRSTLRSL
jgi:hypothetical protein